MKPRLAVSFAMLCAAYALTAATARAQSITTEAAVTAGGSTDSLAAGAMQIRGFGDIPGGIRFFGEASIAQTSAGWTRSCSRHGFCRCAAGRR